MSILYTVFDDKFLVTNKFFICQVYKLYTYLLH